MESEKPYVKSESCDIVIKEEPLDFIPLSKSNKRVCPFSTEYCNKAICLRNSMVKCEEPCDTVIKEESNQIIYDPKTTIHIQQEKSSDEKCDKAFSQRELQDKSDIKIFHPTVHQCNICKAKFRHETSLKKHIEIRHQQTRFSCEKCKKEFLLKESLDQHIKASHEASVQSNHQCASCKRIFKGKSSLMQHTQAVHNLKRKRRIYKCNKCKKKFIDLNKMRSHKISVHLKEKAQTCNQNQCNKPIKIEIDK